MGNTTIGDRSFRCLNCGDEFKFEPVSINMLTAMMRAFDKDHAHCKPSDRGASKMNAKDVIAWRHSWDTGMSSVSIWNFFMCRENGRCEIPYDPSDFGRCFRLLAIAPEWRARLAELGEAHSRWKPFTDAWVELEALWDEETKRDDGCAPKLFARMQQLVEQARAQW